MEPRGKKMEASVKMGCTPERNELSMHSEVLLMPVRAWPTIMNRKAVTNSSPSTRASPISNIMTNSSRKKQTPFTKLGHLKMKSSLANPDPLSGKRLRLKSYPLMNIFD